MANEGINLGLAPETLRVILTTGADFSCTLRLDSAWPTGTTLSLVTASTTWAATIAGTDAVFAVDKAVADTVDDKTPIQLKYVNGTTDQTWAIGTVSRRG
ncbi:LtfC-like domain-containing protein [Nocardioides sp. URHA0032]|uniref:LtfC-like domain-containing protein n=1 Tax=Nocardioides sp. URHA0032 TaxID=1380388 RepID=UPI00048EA7C7|nr:hypothetical protein [Nocardioides sp. URHA0032]